MSKAQSLKYKNYMMVTLKIAVLSTVMVFILAALAVALKKQNPESAIQDNKGWQVMNSY